jgi:cyclic beta-1,2-glucan synthetase
MTATETSAVPSAAPSSTTAFFTGVLDHQPIRGELFGPDHLEAHARNLAASCPARTEAGRPLFRLLQDNSRVLTEAYRAISLASREGEPLGQDAEWLLDNFHIIADAVAEVRTDLPRGFYRLLPKLTTGPLAGFPRIYAVAIELIAHSDSFLDENHLKLFVSAFQTVAPLTVGELWAFPIMLRLCLVDNLRRLADHIVQYRVHRRRAHDWLAKNAGMARTQPGPPDFALEEIHPDWRSCYVTHLHEALHENKVDLADGAESLEQCLCRHSWRSEEMLQQERRRQAVNQVSIGNCVTSLRLLAALDWQRFFEQTSHLEARLSADPAGVYARQDFATRDAYRKIVERLARGAQVDELAVADTILRLAGESGSAPAQRHVGYFLVDAGRPQLEAELGYRAPVAAWCPRTLLAWPHVWYFGVLGAGTVPMLAGLGVACSALGGGPALITALLLLALVPLAGVSVSLVNFLSALTLPPRTLPRLECRQGVPADCPTFVVVPSLLTSAASAARLVERLEIHYLSNPDEHLYFALLTDFADAPAETMPDDTAWVDAALDGIRDLNARYCGTGSERFFLLHRRRQWNAAQGCWMGWERKRGKLAEFNRLLRGAKDTSFVTLSSPLSAVPHIRFVITLDADTQLPRETARRMIATLAHPLNQPRFDPERGRVVRGYGVLQPRISLSLRGARASLFSYVFAGSAGLDPYTTAVSDTYQDLFGTGSFTGKGVYDVDAFQAAAGLVFPDNHVLSHDLIEGNYARCGLVTDIELFDDFPPSYLAYGRREHRWVRGDWQISPWLFHRVPAPGGRKTVNPLGWLERWKIVDNLRRSLVAPSLVAFLVLGWLALPVGAWLWTVLALVILAWPAVAGLACVPFRLLRLLIRRTPGTFFPSEFEHTAAQGLLAAVFLADEARGSLDAVVRTCARMLFTRRKLLEWETSAATERRLGRGFAPFAAALWPASLTAVLVFAGMIWLQPASLPAAFPLLAAWLLSPLIGYVVSRPWMAATCELRPEEQHELRVIARETWGFFETYVGPEDNWLPPDNYQVDPKGAIAHRTSPTNIGLYLLSCIAAHDFGYLAFPTLIDRLEKTFATLLHLDRSDGHFYNWIDTQSLKPLVPIYLSTVDSGNLASCLIVVKQALQEKLAKPLLGPQISVGLQDTADVACAPVLRRHSLSKTVEWSELTHVKKSLAAALACMPELLTDMESWWDKVRQALNALKVQLAKQPAAVGDREASLWAARLDELARDRRDEWAAACRCALAQGMTRLDQMQLESLSGMQAGASPAGASPEVVGQIADSKNGAGVSWAAELGERCLRLAKRAEELAAAMNFKMLYNAERHLFALGYNLTLSKMDNAHYDLLASEACLTSFLAIARGDVPKKHWFQLGRPLTRAGGMRVLLSWGGTMFEYLMPRLLLRGYEGTLLDESQRAAVAAQIEYGRQHHVPWGISESAYNALDGQLNYQYKAFGVPRLGLKRGLDSDLVVAPYATGLAVMTHPRPALANLRRFRSLGAEGALGFFEAVDYNSEHAEGQKRGMIVRCYMAHHQGMLLLGLANGVMQNLMQRRFHAEPMIRATELLLQERVPREAPLVEAPVRDGAAGPVLRETAGLSRRLTTPHTASPRTHLIASAQHAVWLTNAGAGQSTARGLAVTRWREDRTLDAQGQFFYVRDLKSGARWSAGHQPLRVPADEYEVTFAVDKVEFRRLDKDIETRLEVTVSPENHAEVRRLTFSNHGRKASYLEVTSYAEIVLAPQSEDLAHPAFGKLFLETDHVADAMALLAWRRPRAPEQKPIWAMHVLAADARGVAPTQFETDRARFLGRGRSPGGPAALDDKAQPLSGTVGAVLDPIFSLRRRFRVPAGASACLAFTTALADSRAAALALADHYRDLHGVSRAFELAWAHSQVEERLLHLTALEMHQYQRLAAHVLYAGPTLRAGPTLVAANHLNQSSLWRLGLSGDLPIVLVRIASTEEIPLARQLIAAHAFWRLKGLAADLVILNEYEAGYLEEIHQQLQALVRASDDRNQLDKRGGVHLCKASHLAPADVVFLQVAARVVLVGKNGALGGQLDRLERLPALAENGTLPRLPTGRRQTAATAQAAPNCPELVFDNGQGGFTADGREYVIRLASRGTNYALPPLPWINVLANARFGCLVSESGAGFTWIGNSQMQRLTPWRNDPVCDTPSEALYLRNDESGDFWSATPLPGKPGAGFLVRHGRGYSVFEQQSDALAQQLTVFVPTRDAMKIWRLKLRNLGTRPLRLSAIYFADLVLGTTRDHTLAHIVTEYDAAIGAVLARNPMNIEMAGKIAFAAVNPQPAAFTGDRTEFLGRNGSYAEPAAVRRGSLGGRLGPGLDPCVALQTSYLLKPREEKEIVFFLGAASDLEEVERVVNAYRNPREIERAWQDVNVFWNQTCGAVTVQTPNAALDLLMNHWLPYQVLSCRMWARSALYQSGGAYGFRDQLQDVMALVYALPGEAREHIVRAAGRQFVEGDVQHWWHPPSGAGVRTRFSDDFLWLPFVVHHYVTVTGDTGVLDEPVPFLSAPLLQPDQQEDYRVPALADETASLYEHCVRAIQHGLRFGSHGLPLMGGGDWNDGMNRVGSGGRGESVWTGWFLLTIFKRFSALCAERGDGARGQLFQTHANTLQNNLEAHAWDGQWYRRAYFDDGTPLGSAQNDACRIDSLAQSWAVIAGGADPERVRQAMAAVDAQLVRRDERLVLLFAPPFDNTALEPGYIKGYLPGIRENGGQYTHAALWVVQAFSLLGQTDKAEEILNLINPIHHAEDGAGVDRFRLEPYVIPADVYGRPPHTGRGGWSWYTGSAGWFYRVVLETMLGFELHGKRLRIVPRIPASWPEYSLTFRHGTATYQIEVTNVRDGEGRIEVDGQPWDQTDISLTDDGQAHTVVIRHR